ncbi:MAG: GAF domain-containing protein, partial [Anaerolineales bacterium]|nr:GAF domain-containing protein [Anaerolineales bacterium]
MLEETENSTPLVPAGYRLSRLYHAAIGASTILITSLVLLTRLFRTIHPLESLLVWLAAEGGALAVIWFSFRRVSHLQSRYNEQATQQAALIRLSEGFAATQDEAVICNELAQRLHAVQGYDYVAVYTLDAQNVRNLRASLGARKEGDPIQLGPGQGLSERPLLDGRLHYSPDITQEAQHVPGLLSGSEIDVPIRYQDNNLGVLIVESERVNAFDEADFALLTAAADQAAIALQYTQLLKSERERRRTAERLRSATAAITSALDVSAVLDQILLQLEQVVPYDSACVFLLRGNYIQAKAARGLPNPEEVLEQLLPADNELFQAVVDNNHAVIIADISKDKRFLGWGGTSSMKSWMGVPLRARGEITGYLTLDSRELAAYQPEMSDLAQIFADQAAVALEHAQLYDRTRGAAERMLILHQVSQEV